jgi:simple sugar transport system permease protein
MTALPGLASPAPDPSGGLEPSDHVEPSDPSDGSRAPHAPRLSALSTGGAGGRAWRTRAVWDRVGDGVEAIAIPVTALRGALALFGAFMAVIGESPLEVYALIYRGGFGSIFSLQSSGPSV